MHKHLDDGAKGHGHGAFKAGVDGKIDNVKRKPGFEKLKGAVISPMKDRLISGLKGR